MLVFAGALLLLGGCSSRSSATAGADARVDAPKDAAASLVFTVNGAQSTQRLTTSTMESKEAAAGNRFVVLDVSVRNPDADPQILLEGKLVALSESDVQAFEVPVTLFSDDYLSVQVLAPRQRVRGKVAYEVPEDLPGVLYWSPGSGGKRILLHLNPSQAAQRTLADAGLDDAIPPTDLDASSIASNAPVERRAYAPPQPQATRQPPSPVPADVAAIPRPTSRTQSSPEATATQRPASAGERDSMVRKPTRPKTVALRSSSAIAPQVATGAAPPTIEQGAREVAVAAPASTTASAARGMTPVDPPVAASSLEPVPVPPSSVATAAQSSPMDRLVASLMASSPRSSGPTGDQEHIRRLACQGLVTRNDPWEKANNLGFFRTSCRDYPMPSRWQKGPKRSLFGRMSAALAGNARTAMAGHAPACYTASQASRLVCEDAVLSAMDIQLDQSVQRASHHVDATALEREQAQWSGRVRNACGTIACLRQAYAQQQARIDGLIPTER